MGTENGKIASSSLESHNVCRRRKTNNSMGKGGKCQCQRCSLFFTSYQRRLVSCFSLVLDEVHAQNWRDIYRGPSSDMPSSFDEIDQQQQQQGMQPHQQMRRQQDPSAGRGLP